MLVRGPLGAAGSRCPRAELSRTGPPGARGGPSRGRGRGTGPPRGASAGARTTPCRGRASAPGSVSPSTSHRPSTADAGTTRDPEPGGDEPLDGGQVVGLEGDLGLEPGRGQQPVGGGPERRRPAERDERLLGRGRPARRCPARPARWRLADDEHERLGQQPLPPQPVLARAAAGQLDVDRSVGPRRAVGRRRRGAARPARCGWSARKPLTSCGTSHVPIDRSKATPTDPGLGVQQLLDRGQPVVEVVQQPVDVPLERPPRLGRPQHPAVRAAAAACRPRARAGPAPATARAG